MTISKRQQHLRASILETIYVRGPISRIDIAKLTKITPATTSSITSELLTKHLIQEIGEEENDTQKVGRKKILLKINPNHSYYIGSEITEKYFTFALTTNTGYLIDSQLVSISKDDLSTKGSQLYIDHLMAFIDKYQNFPISAIGIAVPGRYIENHPLIITDNQLWERFNLNVIKTQISYPIFISNNVNCMAIAQRLFSHSPNDDNFIFFHFKRGMHCSYMYNGHIYGRDNIVIGEIGHTIVSLDGELCSCGKKGCLQTYLGESWLIKKAKLIFDKVPDSLINTLVKEKSDITIETLLLAYDLGDTTIISLLNNAIKYLAQSLFNLSLLIDSKKIYLHSPLLSHPKLCQLLDDYIKVEPKLLQTQTAPVVEIVPYDILTGAKSAVGLAIQHSLLIP